MTEGRKNENGVAARVRLAEHTHTHQQPARSSLAGHTNDDGEQLKAAAKQARTYLGRGCSIRLPARASPSSGARSQTPAALQAAKRPEAAVPYNESLETRCWDERKSVRGAGDIRVG